jgi:hypothetical protein
VRGSSSGIVVAPPVLGAALALPAAARATDSLQPGGIIVAGSALPAPVCRRSRFALRDGEIVAA